MEAVDLSEPHEGTCEGFRLSNTQITCKGFRLSNTQITCKGHILSGYFTD